MPPILDVAIGTIFVFLLFSLVVSALNEYILSLTDQRAKFLRLGLMELLGKSAPQKGMFTKQWGQKLDWLRSLLNAVIGFLRWLLTSVVSLGGLVKWGADDPITIDGKPLLGHGLLNSFSRSDAGNSIPSYIPAGAFVTGLLDIVVQAPSTLWSASDAAPLEALVTSIRAAKTAALGAGATPIGPTQFDGALTPFTTAFAGLAVAPSPTSPLARFHYRVAEALAKNIPQKNKTTTKTTVLAAGNCAAAVQAFPEPPDNLTPLLTAMAARANNNWDLLKQLVEGLDAPVQPVDFASELNKLEAEAVAAIALIVAPTLKHTGESIEASLNSLPESKLRESLLSLFRSVEGDVQKFKLAIEGWFNGVMDRVSGWYKRFAQKWMIVLGLVLAAIFNVDTIEIVRVLSNNPNLAKAVADQAATYVSENGKPLTPEELATQREARLKAVKETEDNYNALTAAGEKDEVKLKGARDKRDRAREEADALKTYQAAVAKLTETGLPIGWTKEVWEKLGLSEPEQANENVSASRSLKVSVLAYMFAGWFLTAIAASLGAPFWFDLLGRFVNIRAAGRPPGEKEATSTPTRPPPASLDTTPGTHAPVK